MNKYLVSITIHIGGYEKVTHNVVEAEDVEQASITALKDECHNDPDVISDSSVWDDLFYYEVYEVQEITPNQLHVLKKLKLAY